MHTQEDRRIDTVPQARDGGPYSMHYGWPGNVRDPACTTRRSSGPPSRIFARCSETTTAPTSAAHCSKSMQASRISRSSSVARGRATSPPTGSPHTWRLARRPRLPTPPSIGSWRRSNECSVSPRSPARSRSDLTSRAPRGQRAQGLLRGNGVRGQAHRAARDLEAGGPGRLRQLVGASGRSCSPASGRTWTSRLGGSVSSLARRRTAKA
jgi:hypothetical protein